MTTAAATPVPAARPSAAREATLLVGGRVVGGLASFAGVRILTAVMSPEVYGRYALLLAFLGLVSGFLVGPFAQAMNRFVHEAGHAGRMRTLVVDGLRVTTAMALLGALATPAFAWGWLDGDPRRWVVAALLAATLVGANVRDRGMGLFNTFRWRGRYVVLYAADAWGRTIGVAGAILLFGSSLAAAAAGLAFATWVVAAAAIPWLVGMARWKPSEPRGSFDFSQARAYALPLFGVNLLSWSLTSADRYVIERVLGPEALGRYVASSQVASAAPTVLLGVCFPLFTPMLYQRMASHPNEPLRLDRFVLGIAALGIALAGLVSADVEAAFRVLVSGRSYDTGDSVVPFVATGLALNAIQQVAEHEAYFQRRPGRIAIASAGATAVSLVVNLTATRWLGIAGAGLASCLTQATLLGGTVLVYRPSIRAATWGKIALLALAMIATVGAARWAIPGTLSPLVRAPLRWLMVALAFGVIAAPHARALRAASD